MALLKWIQNVKCSIAMAYLLEPNIIIPEEGIMETLSISEEGEVNIILGGDQMPTKIGEIDLYRFVNNSGLKSIGKNLFKITGASGDEIPGKPGQDGFGNVLQGFLEMSNVNLAEEMVQMIVAQRAYESNSKAIQTSDSMLATAIALKR